MSNGTAPNMKLQPVKFFLASLCLHLAALLVMAQTGPAERGVARNMGHAAASPLSVRLISKEDPPVAQLAVQIEKKAVPPLDVERPVAPPAMPDTGTQGWTDGSSQNYAPVGLLTRLPQPVTAIDLNTPAIGEVAFSGEIKLIILINADGMVDDVVASIADENARRFADRVAAHFRAAHFLPGEINGQAVKSELQISVVSESLDPAGLRPKTAGQLTVSD